MVLTLNDLRKKHTRTVLEIDKEQYGDGCWTVKDLTDMYDEFGVSGAVADDSGLIVGYVLFQRYDGMNTVHGLVVRKSCRREYVGRTLMHYVMRRSKKVPLVVEIGERNLVAQLFLKSLGFRCIRIHHNSSKKGDDLYEFVRHPQVAEKV